ncbi:hypothetical protein CVT26_004803 [Gymnopilus dilepis]|uniref:Uncharacterized protein n=1 Tax=Gymnopilus dilepis TaxID=231916 RepID=A0A409XZF4_9AGAR|nr:hypothetical protein CVT26_004803 [Gymnopilus dilepis]
MHTVLIRHTTTPTPTTSSLQLLLNTQEQQPPPSKLNSLLQIPRVRTRPPRLALPPLPILPIYCNTMPPLHLPNNPDPRPSATSSPQQPLERVLPRIQQRHPARIGVACEYDQRGAWGEGGVQFGEVGVERGEGGVEGAGVRWWEGGAGGGGGWGGGGGERLVGGCFWCYPCRSGYMRQ